MIGVYPKRSVRCITAEIFPDEGAAYGACGKSIVVAFKATPLGEMVCKIKGRRCWSRVFVVNEADRLDFARYSSLMRMDYDVTTKQIAVRGDQLKTSVSRTNQTSSSAKTYAIAAQVGYISQFGYCTFELVLKTLLTRSLNLTLSGQCEDPFLYDGPDIWCKLVGSNHINGFCRRPCIERLLGKG